MSRVDMAGQLDQQLPATRNLHESLTRAEELATRRKHSIVGLDHLLLALGQDPEAVAVLLVCKVDVKALCQDLLRKIGPEARMRSPNTVPPSFDVTVQNLIAHASAAALQAGQREIDGSNVLSAIISGEGGMITHKILQKHGLTFDETVSNLETKNQTSPLQEDQQSELANNGEDKPDQELNESYKLVPEVADEDVAKARNPETLSDPAVRQDSTAAPANEAGIKTQAEASNQGSSESIVQAEARPEDYGMTVEGREYHPVPPKVNITGANITAQNSQKGPNQASINPHKPVQNHGVTGGPPPAQHEVGRAIGQNTSSNQMGKMQQQNGAPNKEQMPEQEFAADHQSSAQPMPPVQQTDPRNLDSSNLDPRNSAQGNPDQRGSEQRASNQRPAPNRPASNRQEEQAGHPQAKTRKVSFKSPASPQPSVGKDSNGPEGQPVEPLSETQNKFIKEDKYGSTPPQVPVSPQIKKEINKEINQEENQSDLAEEEITPPHFRQIGETNIHEQKALKSQQIQQTQKGQSATGQPVHQSMPQPAAHLVPPHTVSARTVSAHAVSAHSGPPHSVPGQQPPVPGLHGAQIQQAQQIQQGQQAQPGQQFPLNNSTPLQPHQQPAPPDLHPQSYGHTQETMDSIASSIAQNQKHQQSFNGQDQVVENIPKVMRVGKVHYLEVRVAKFANTEIELSPEDYGLRSKQNGTPLTKAITVRLTGSDGLFLIDCATASTQWTEMHGGITNDADFAVWRWRVLPRKSGLSKLRLDITARTSNEDGLTAEIPIQPSKSIEVKVTRDYKAIFKKLFIIAGIFIVGFAVAQYGLKTYKLVEDQIKEFSRVD